jgi:hypothetical protein
VTGSEPPRVFYSSTSNNKNDDEMLGTEKIQVDGYVDHVAKSLSIKKASKQKSNTEPPTYEPVEEVLLVDEVDVFFCSEFYGQTYNQVVQLREP